MLPEKWCVEVNKDNIDILNKFIHANLTNYVGYNKMWINKLSGETVYLHYPQCKDYVHSDYKINVGYTLISFEDFERYVLNKEDNITEDMSYLIPILKQLNIE